MAARDFLTWAEIERVADDLLGIWQEADALPTTPVLVSLDFDFFAQVPRFEDDAFIEAWQDGWGAGDERRSVEEHELRWRKLIEHLRVAGADPNRCVQVAEPHPEQLLENVAPERLWVSNSHAWGAAVVVALSRACAGQKVEVISLDAHHDLGYHNEDGDTPTKVRRASHKKVTCDNWLLACLERGYVSHVTIIYPDWKELSEWTQTDAPLHRRKHRSRIKATTWSGWGHELPAEATWALVRSSEWLPPWGGLDKIFAQCAHSLMERATIACVAERSARWPRVGVHDPLTPRTFTF